MTLTNAMGGGWRVGVEEGRRKLRVYEKRENTPEINSCHMYAMAFFKWLLHGKGPKYRKSSVNMQREH